MARRLALVAVLAGLVLALPTLARAATYCVNAAGCSGTNEPDLQTALNAAMATTSEADTVQVGNPGAPTSGYGYTDGGVPANQVHIVGAGPAATVLTSTSGIVLQVIGTGSSISNLTVQLPALAGTGIDTSGSLSDVDVTSLDSGVHNQNAVIFTGTGNENWTGGQVLLPSGTASQLGVGSTMGGGSLDLEDLTIRSNSEGIITSAGDDMTVRRVSVSSGIGLVASGAQMTLDDVAFRSAATPGFFLDVANSGSNDAAAHANHVTAFGDGSSGSMGLLVSANSGHSATLDIRNSIIRNFDFVVSRSSNGSGSVANVTASYTDAGLVHALDNNFSSGTGSITSGPGMVDTDPLLVNPAAGDFSLSPGSPAIDAGDPAGLFAGDSVTDLLGAPRISNGRQDMGAVEFQAPPPAPPPTPPAKDRLAPKLKLSKTPKSVKLGQLLKGIKFTVTTSEASSINATLAGSASSVKLAKSFPFTLAHKHLGLKAGKRRITLKVPRKILGHSRRFTLRLTVVATDASGNKATIRRTIKVR